MPNAPSESLEKKELFFHFLCKVWLRTPDPATALPNLILLQNEPPLVALSMPNAPSESPEKIFLAHLFSHFLAPNTCRQPFSSIFLAHPVCFHWSRSSWPRRPDPATAFPNLILVENELPLVALTSSNKKLLGTSASLRASRGAAGGLLSYLQHASDP